MIPVTLQLSLKRSSTLKKSLFNAYDLITYYFTIRKKKRKLNVCLTLLNLYLN